MRLCTGRRRLVGTGLPCERWRARGGWSVEVLRAAASSRLRCRAARAASEERAGRLIGGGAAASSWLRCRAARAASEECGGKTRSQVLAGSVGAGAGSGRRGVSTGRSAAEVSAEDPGRGMREVFPGPRCGWAGTVGRLRCCGQRPAAVPCGEGAGWGVRGRAGSDWRRPDWVDWEWRRQSRTGRLAAVPCGDGDAKALVRAGAGRAQATPVGVGVRAGGGGARHLLL